jgi:hypothetical protein
MSNIPIILLIDSLKKILEIYREKRSMELTQKKLDKLDKTAASGQWLIRLGLWELVCGMMILSQEYGLAWATVRFLALRVTVHISSLMGQHFCGVILQSAINAGHSLSYDRIDKRVDVW